MALKCHHSLLFYLFIYFLNIILNFLHPLTLSHLAKTQPGVKPPVCCLCGCPWASVSAGENDTIGRLLSVCSQHHLFLTQPSHPGASHLTCFPIVHDESFKASPVSSDLWLSHLLPFFPVDSCDSSPSENPSFWIKPYSVFWYKTCHPATSISTLSMLPLMASEEASPPMRVVRYPLQKCDVI